MPLPENLATVTVTATYEETDGTLAAGGTVTFDPGRLITASVGQVIFGRPATADIIGGQIEITLPATDNEDLNPTGITYTVTEQVTDWPARVYQIELPAALAPSVDLSELSPVADPPDPVEQAGGDLSGTYASPVVVRTHLAGPLPVAQGGTGLDTPGDPGAVLTSDDDGTISWQPAAAPPAALALAADTGADGFPLVNDTPGIVSWTVPDDGQLHLVQVIANASVTASETGGAVGVTWTSPDGGTQEWTVIPGDQADLGWDYALSQLPAVLVAPGTAVTVAQATALTAGAATVWAQVWAA